MAHQIPLFERLTPSTPFQGGRLTDTDVLTLGDAARMASDHSGESVTVGDFLRAAARGEITMHAVCPRDVTMEPCREGDMPMPIPQRSIPTLPLGACLGLRTWAGPTGEHMNGSSTCPSSECLVDSRDGNCPMASRT